MESDCKQNVRQRDREADSENKSLISEKDAEGT